MSQKIKIRISFLIGAVSWLLFSFFDTYALMLNKYEMTEAYVDILPQVFLSIFILSVLIYYRYLITKAENINFMDLLWRVFITGLVTTIISLTIRLIFDFYADSSFIKNPVTINFFYHIYVALVVIYLVSTFVVWKRLILYQKSKNLIQLWNFFEYALILSIAFDFFGNKMQDTAFNIALVFLTTFSLILSFNLKWIAYLNFRQKWKSILFILLSGIYLYHFFLNLSIYSATGELIYDLMDRVFVVAMLIFIFIYACISILVTLFNLPTSSVFEQKLKEAVDYQKLSQSLPSGQSETETYEILLDSSMSAVFADAGWIEMKLENDETNIIARNILKSEVREIKEIEMHNQIKSVVNLNFSGNISQNRIFGSLNKFEYKSIFALPILIKNNQIGSLVLLQEVSDAFNREMADIIKTFVNQASITLENSRLIGDALENERYKEQLKIAKLVQKSLLPDHLEQDSVFCMAAYSMAAEEVGGDYYDTINLGNGRYGVIIGDVSGKGTSAAFNMAQMKGIFHSLAQLNFSPSEFIIKANQALSHCLEKSSFITASYYVIDTVARKIDFVRAGHCPTLLYKKKTKTLEFLETKGMGLGILRNSEYEKYVHSNTFEFESGDILLLYTDGITEASDNNHNQFGNEGLKTALLTRIDKSIDEIKEGIIEELYEFLDGKFLNDDYTLVIIKFN